MTKVFSLLVLCCLIGCIISSCNQYASSVTDNTMADTISVGNTSSVDSATYTFPDRSKCPIKVVVNASYPIDKSLQSIYSTAILELSDTVDISENLNGYANYILMQYCATNNAYSLDDSTDINNESYEPLKSFESRINISKLYDNKGIVTFCKEIIILKNEKVAYVTHNFYNIYAPEEKQIRCSDLFIEGSFAEISQLMRNKLLEQLNLTSEDNLADFGYITLDNIHAHNNFYFGEKGITWSFFPQEIAITSVGEPKITLTYESLKPFMVENSDICSLF